MGRRRAAPFTRVLQGARKEAARTKYLAFLAGTSTRPSRIGLGDPRPPQIRLAVNPFGLTLPQNVLAEASALQTAVVAMQTVAPVAARVKQSTSTNQAGITLGLPAQTEVTVKAEFSAARIIRKVASSDRATPEVSKITGLTYGRIPTASLSIPIGQKVAGDTLQAALVEIRGPLIAASTAPTRTKVYLQDEEF